MDTYSVVLTAMVDVCIDPRELSEDEDEHSLIFRGLQEQYPELKSPTINSFSK